MQLIDDVAFFEAHHVMPELGGRLDQPPKFLQAIDVVHDERERTAHALVKLKSALAGGGA